MSAGAEPAHRGGCLCGKVRYRLARPIRFITHCHCSMCRKQHGAAFATYAAIPRKYFALEGEPSTLVRFASSPGVIRAFCGHCGSSLIWESDQFPKFVDVAVSTLDEPPEHQPDAHIFVASKVPWYTIRDDLPQHQEGPPPIQETGSSITTE